MDIISSLVEWSKTLKPWQSDALRRCMVEPLPEDKQQILANLKAYYGLLPQSDADLIPFENAVATLNDGIDTSIRLVGIDEFQYIGIMDKDAKLEFETDGLTVIYGDNGSGKSGFGRVFRRACRSREAGERILPDLYNLDPTEDNRGKATFKVRLNDTNSSVPWVDGGPASAILSRIAVFDKDCARVHVANDNKIDFLPYGADILITLAKVQKELKATLESELSNVPVLPPDLVALPADSAVRRFIGALKETSTVADVKAYSELDAISSVRLTALRAKALEREGHTPLELSKKYARRKKSVESLKDWVELAEKYCAGGAQARSSQLAETRRAAVKDEQLALAVSLSDEPLSGAGTPSWKALFEAAKAFALEEAYKEREYQDTFEERCVLCQQELLPDGTARMRRFNAFVTHEMTTRATNAMKALDDELASANEVGSYVLSEDSEIAEELERHSPGLTIRVRAAIEQLSTELAAIALILTNVQPAEAEPRELTAGLIKDLESVASSLGAEIKQLEGATVDESVAREEAEYILLQQKAKLTTHAEVVVEFAKGQARAKKLRDSITALAIRKVTDKQNELNNAVITEELSRALRNELTQLGLNYIEPQFELYPEAGTLKSRIVIAGLRSSGLKKSKSGVLGILSEGEALVIALAAFFAELELAPSFNVIVFDDPVSSLDHMWRDAVARRIAKLALTRQVVVLTHDLLFLHDLDGHVTGFVPQPYRAYGVERQLGKTGIVLLDAKRPIHMLNIKDRITVLRSRHTVLKGISDSKGVDCEEYRGAVESAYTLLRRAWERAIEEVLLDKVIFRFRRGIQTIDITKRLSDVFKREDFQGIETAMTKLSQVGDVHDEASAARSRVPQPQEFASDVDGLESWCADIKKRRKTVLAHKD